MQACRGRCAAAAGDEDNDDKDRDDDDNDGDDDDDNDGDDDDDNDDEDRGVLINVVENPTEEYHAREGDSPSLIGQGENKTLLCSTRHVEYKSESVNAQPTEVNCFLIKFLRKTDKPNL